MKRTPPPLRFLVLVVGGWICMRTAVYAPGWWVGEGVAGPVAALQPVPWAPAPASAHPAPREPVGRKRPPTLPALLATAAFADSPPIRLSKSGPTPRTTSETARIASNLMPLPAAAASLPPTVMTRLPPARFEPTAASTSASPGRWSGSAWLLLRSDDGAALAQGGTLGGSQGGLRLGYRLNGDNARPFGIAARLYAPAGDRRAAVAALGLEWRPLARVPVSLVAERREALGSRGRSAFAVGAHGGVSGARLLRGFRLDAYGQAGIVGARSRDLYADGAARLTIPAGRLDVGAGLSGGAQPGAARLDAGPVVSLRLPAARLRVSAEWRFRIAGDARPDSGPALTVGADF